MKTNTNSYNGHKNYDFWNVALWIANDETMYNRALACLNIPGFTTRRAAQALLEIFPTQTPDGAKYTLANIEAAISDLAE